VADQTHSLARRILFGMSGQALARFANALSTVALVPILIASWGLQGYGEWVALIALVSYASYANLGLVTIAGNDVVIGIGAQNLDRAKRSFGNALAFTHIIVLPILIVLAGAVSLIPFGRILNLEQISQSDAKIVAWLAIGQVAANTYRGLAGSILNGQGKYALNYITDGCFRLAELAAISVAVLWLGLRQTGVVSILAFSSSLELIVMVVLARGMTDVSWWKMRPLDGAWIRTLAKPAIGFVLSNLSTQSILLQGPRIALGIVSGGTAVALYNVYGIVLRLADQIVRLMSAPLEVEIAQAWHQGQRARAYRLIVVGTQLSVYSLVACGLALLLAGPVLFPLWTAGRVSFDPGLLALFLAVALSAQLGRISTQALIGANRIFTPSLFMVPVAVATLGLGAILATPWSVSGMALGIVIGELGLSFLMLRAVQGWTGTPGASVLRELLNVRDLARMSTRVARRLFFRGA
jgi:O-antigen/teichoic acid export membrane protein